MIILESYNLNWPILYEQEKRLLLSAAAKWNIKVEHIGSTAIPKIYAKPVIDIMIGVSSLAIADQHLIALIQAIGYDYISEYEQNMPNRRYFEKNNNNIRTYQIHLVEYGSKFWLRHLLFRDYLRSHPNIAKEYEALKLDIAPRFTDSNQYSTAKNEFIRKIENNFLKDDLL